MKDIYKVICLILPFLLGINIVSAVDLTPNVNAHYTLNETSGTAVSDSSGNGINGITVNNPLWVSGKLNNSLLFNGANQYVDLGNNFGFEYNKSFSVEAWVYPSVTSSARAIFSKADGSSPSIGWNLQIYNTKVYMTLQNNAPSAKILQVHVNDAVPTNLWQHIVVTYDGSGRASGVKIYVNGTDKFLVTDYDTLNNASISNVRNSLIGAIDGSSGKSGYFSGGIDEVVVYNKTLTPAEVSFRWNNSYGTELMASEIPPTTTTTTLSTTTTTIPTNETTTTTISANISVKYCSDNSTLYIRIAKIQSGVLNITEEYMNCDYGCSDYSCNPSDFIIVIYIIGVFVGLIILILIIMRLIR